MQNKGITEEVIKFGSLKISIKYMSIWIDGSKYEKAQIDNIRSEREEREFKTREYHEWDYAIIRKFRWNGNFPRKIKTHQNYWIRTRKSEHINNH